MKLNKSVNVFVDKIDAVGKVKGRLEGNDFEGTIGKTIKGRKQITLFDSVNVNGNNIDIITLEESEYKELKNSKPVELDYEGVDSNHGKVYKLSSRVDRDTFQKMLDSDLISKGWIDLHDAAEYKDEWVVLIDAKEEAEEVLEEYNKDKGEL